MSEPQQITKRLSASGPDRDGDFELIHDFEGDDRYIYLTRAEADALIKVLSRQSSVAPAPQEAEVCWLIEKYINDALVYWEGRRLNSWTTDVNEAVRFSRHDDGARVLAWLLDSNGRVVQHLCPAARLTAEASAEPRTLGEHAAMLRNGGRGEASAALQRSESTQHEATNLDPVSPSAREALARRSTDVESVSIHDRDEPSSRLAEASAAAQETTKRAFVAGWDAHRNGQDDAHPPTLLDAWSEFAAASAGTAPQEEQP